MIDLLLQVVGAQSGERPRKAFVAGNKVGIEIKDVHGVDLAKKTKARNQCLIDPGDAPIMVDADRHTVSDENQTAWSPSSSRPPFQDRQYAAVVLNSPAFDGVTIIRCPAVESPLPQDPVLISIRRYQASHMNLAATSRAKANKTIR